MRRSGRWSKSQLYDTKESMDIVAFARKNFLSEAALAELLVILKKPGFDLSRLAKTVHCIACSVS